MTQLDEVGRASAKGGFILFLGKISSILILAINTIIVGRLLGPEAYGQYTVALIIPSFMIILSDFGVTAGLMRFSATYCSEKKGKLANNMIKIGILLKILGSLFFSVLIIIFSNFFAVHLLNRSETGYLIRMASLYMIGQTVLNSIITTFIGLDESGKSGILMNIQAITTFVFSITFITQGKGVNGAILGTSIGSLTGAVCGIILFLLKSSPRLELMNAHDDQIDIFLILKTLLIYGAPIYLSSITLSLGNQLRRILLALYASNITIGNLQIAMNFATIIISLASSISDSLFPAFSKLNIDKDWNSIEIMFKLSVKYSSLIVLPASFALAVLSKSVVYVLYGSQYNMAPYYLSLYMMTFLYVGLGGFIIGIVFNSQADTSTTFKISLINLAISVPLYFILIPLYGVTGLIISLLITQIFKTCYGLYLLHRSYKLYIDFYASGKILVSTIISTVIAHIIINTASFDNDIYNIFFNGIIFIAFFLVSAPLIGAISEEDLNIFDRVIVGLPLVSNIGKLIIRLEQKIIKINKNFSNS